MEKQFITSNKNIFPLPELFWYFITNHPSVISLLVPVNREQNKIIMTYLDTLISKSIDTNQIINFFIENDLIVGLKKIKCKINDVHVNLSCEKKSIRIMSYFVKYDNFRLIYDYYYIPFSDTVVLRGLISLITSFIEKNMANHLINLLEPHYNNNSLTITHIILNVFEESLMDEKNINTTYFFVKSYFEKHNITLKKKIKHARIFPYIYNFLKLQKQKFQ